MLGPSINDDRARGGEGVVKEWTRVLISCVIMYVTRGGGVKKSEIFMDLIDGSPLRGNMHMDSRVIKVAGFESDVNMDL